VWCDIDDDPIYYDYGTSVVYTGNNVYVSGQDVGTADEYYEEASDLASDGTAEDAKAEWQSLGVFAMVQGEQRDANIIFQLAVSKEGTIRGTYHNILTDQTLPVRGSVNKETQRAAWTVGENKTTVYDTGIANLTKDEAPLLVHLGKEKTQQWLLVRMARPEEEEEQQGE